MHFPYSAIILPSGMTPTFFASLIVRALIRLFSLFLNSVLALMHSRAVDLKISQWNYDFFLSSLCESGINDPLHYLLMAIGNFAILQTS